MIKLQEKGTLRNKFFKEVLPDYKKSPNKLKFSKFSKKRSRPFFTKDANRDQDLAIKFISDQNLRQGRTLTKKSLSRPSIRLSLFQPESSLRPSKQDKRLSNYVQISVRKPQTTSTSPQRKNTLKIPKTLNRGTRRRRSKKLDVPFPISEPSSSGNSQESESSLKLLNLNPELELTQNSRMNTETSVASIARSRLGSSRALIMPHQHSSILKSPRKVSVFSIKKDNKLARNRRKFNKLARRRLDLKRTFTGVDPETKKLIIQKSVEFLSSNSVGLMNTREEDEEDQEDVLRLRKEFWVPLEAALGEYKKKMRMRVPKHEKFSLGEKLDEEGRRCVSECRRVFEDSFRKMKRLTFKLRSPRGRKVKKSLFVKDVKICVVKVHRYRILKGEVTPKTKFKPISRSNQFSLIFSYLDGLESKIGTIILIIDLEHFKT